MPASYHDFCKRNHALVSFCASMYDNIQSQGLRQELPFLLFYDQLPVRAEAEIQMRELAREGHAGCDSIIIYFEPSPDDKKKSWELITAGPRDIYRWCGEDDCRDYLTSTIERNERINNILCSALVKDNLVGESKAWKLFLRRIIEVTLYSDSNILLMGESGTGKELISRLIHTIDPRNGKKELILVDCTTIVPELSGSEFFGHERGAYTNAVQSRDGAFSLAHKGTLFLDEIGELPMKLQAELLRVIQEHKFKKVGGNNWNSSEFRLVCATHRNLRQYIEEQKFRQDLFYRISDFEFYVPSLKDRVEDIPLLAKHFLSKLFEGKQQPEMEDNIIEYLVKKEYPGNVRELQQLIRRIGLRHVNHRNISLGEIPGEDRLPDHSEPYNVDINLNITLRRAILSGASLWDLKNLTMHEAIRVAMELSNGNKKMAADKLGVTLRAVQQFLKNNQFEPAADDQLN